MTRSGPRTSGTTPLRSRDGQRRPAQREAKRSRNTGDELKLSVAATAVLRDRYLLRDEQDRVVESPGEMMDRVAAHVASVEGRYRPGAELVWAERFSAMLRRLDFLPNSPTLMNAGTGLGLLSGCVVLPIEDSLRSIFAALGQTALVHQAGGGTGYSFSHLRPAGDRVASTHGTASGPLSFMEIFDLASDVIRRGGRRRGASMAVLHVSHPDIGDFVTAKQPSHRLQNFTLSVAAPDSFMRAVVRGGKVKLRNPRNGRVTGEVDAAELFDLICRAAHATGDPGLLFIDRINRANPLPHSGRIEATNPCGEVPLLPYESCNLGSINLSRFVKAQSVDWHRLDEVVRLAVRFLDDVIDASDYPFPELAVAAHASRKIGLGVMGLAELLASLGIPYDSAQAVRLAGRIAARIQSAAHAASRELAQERGPFELFGASTFAAQGLPPMRNAQLTSVAPTGTVSLIAGTTSGIEPMFAIGYVRSAVGRRLVELNPLFDRVARERGFYSEQLMADVARTGGVRHNPAVPDGVRAAFPTALEIAPEWHLKMQAAVQRHVDAAVSKTVNLPASATVEAVGELFMRAWEARVKGITIYRYGSRSDQVLTLLGGTDASAGPPVQVHESFAGGCVGATCEF